jgi:hypothetical protein
VTQPTPEQRKAARDFFNGRITPDTAAARDALLNLYADGYAAGALATAVQLPGASLVANLAGVFGTADPATAWAAWEPGNADAAVKLDGPGFSQLLADDGLPGLKRLTGDVEDTVDGISQTLMDRMGSLLAEGALNGDSVDTIAASLGEVLDDPRRAYTIADTELARATSAASRDQYAQAGVGQWDWLLSPGACPECEGEKAANPHSIDDEMPPAHPSCRCSSAPIDPGAAPDTPDVTTDGDA